MVDDIIELIKDGNLSLKDLLKIKQVIEDKIDEEEYKEFIDEEGL
jgi:hypothetical protein|nr:MAG TPA: AbiTii [Caudoviricetes sp.]